MKILFVLDTGFDTPGPSNHLLETIIERALKEGNEVHIIESHRTGVKPDIPESLCNFKGLTYSIINEEKVNKNNTISRYINEIKYSLKCKKEYKKIKNVDVVFLQSCNTAAFHVYFIKKIIKKPIVFNVQDLFPLNAAQIGMLNSSGLIYKTFAHLQRYAYKNASRIITISDDIKKSLTNEKVNPDKINVIHNWSYTDEIINIEDSDNIFIKKNNICDNHFKVVYAGNIGRMQNVDVIMSAANVLKNNKDIKFYIIGDGVSKEKYVTIAKEQNLDNVVFLPMHDSKYAPHIYSMADINLIPLGKGIIKTALPSKTATCLSCGKPIIACFDLDSCFAEILRGCEKCAVVESDDYEGLAKYINLFYDKKINGYSKDTRELFKNKFSKDTNSLEYVKVMNLLSHN